MVMALVSELGRVRPVCLSRIYLTRSAQSLDRGETIAAGCLLREAVDQYLLALCQYHDCPLKRKADRTPSLMLNELWKAKQLTEGGYKWIRDSISVGNRLAHCRPVRPSEVSACISLLHRLMDNSPEIIFPTRNGGVL